MMRFTFGEDVMRFKLLLWVPVLGLGAGMAHGQAFVEMSTPGGENISYAYADVLRANPTYEVIRVAGVAEECNDPAAHNDPSENETGHVVTIGATSMNWSSCQAAAGHEERRISGYEVEYRYKGQVYMSHMGYDPGNKLRIRITVAPAD